MTTQLTKIQIPGSKDAFVVRFGIREVGTIARYNGKSAWTACVGVGAVARHLGTFVFKADAMAAIVKASR